MKRAIAFLSVAAMVLLGLVAVSGPAGAVVPGTNGRILFARCIRPSKCFDQSSPVADWEIVAADPDGANETVLAGPYPRSVWDDHFTANWSPDGKSAIFMADFGNGQGIWEVNADGTGFHEVFAAPAGTFFDDGPAFTPDGTHIIFTRCCGRETFGYSLWMINSDGTRLKDVTKERVVDGDSASDNLPQVSPDGTLITFNRNACYDPSDCGNRLVTVNINGGNRVELTDPSLGHDDYPNWSPDSKKIVFSWFPFDGPSGVVTINADGSGFTQLTFDTAGEFSGFASYSPDGTKIVFTRCPSTGSCDLFTMNPDGSGVSQVTKTPAEEFWPQWAAAS
jgi:Tol biopolymer transport system component